MFQNKCRIRLLLLSCLFTSVVIAALGTVREQRLIQDKTRNGKAHQAEQIDTTTFPIADFAAAEIANPSERAKREAKGKKYNSRVRNMPPITEASDSIQATIDWDVGLSAFPVEQSTAVILGKVTKADAHLSQDKTNVYSEFEVELEEVLKPDPLISLTPGSLVTVERVGGRVRFPSGKMMISVVSHQEMPKIGYRYLLFLTHQGLTGPLVPEDFFILTGYELLEDRVCPLDKTLPGHPITAYRGVDLVTFLNDFNSALRASPMQTKPRPV